MESETNRGRKFGRYKTAAPFALTTRDRAMLRDIAEYRFLNSEQLLALHSGGKRNLKQRLSLLYHHHFIDRPPRQRSADLASAHLVYSLDRKGVEALAASGDERDKLFRRVRETERTASLIAHALMISQFRVCLILALKKRPDIRLTRWMQGDELKATLHRARGRSPELVPDAFFTLKDENAVEGKNTVNFFLEADRTTETAVSIFLRKKLQVYWSWKDDARIKDALGIARFRVLTVASTEGRSESLRHIAVNASPSGKPSPMFLFAPQSLYSIASPDAILESAWKSPKDDNPHFVIE